VDTSAYYALADRREGNHGTARAIASQLADERRVLYTTNLILAETHALVLARLGPRVALRVLQEIDNSEIRVVRPDSADEQGGRAILVKYADKAFSLTDAISFAAMDRLHRENPARA
jgi:predicted nucleic acid-binding protein